MKRTIDECNQFNKQIFDLIRKDGRMYVTSSSVNDKLWIRVAILTTRTHLGTIKELIEILKEKVAFLKALATTVSGPSGTANKPKNKDNCKTQ